MFTRVMLSVALTLSCASTMSLAQQQPPSPAAPPSSSANPTTGQELPVILQEKIVAGKTQPGTRVQANLVVATLVNGKVIPKNALLSGEVVESRAKTSSEPSRLAVRLDSAHWKNGSASIQVYLTSLFFPVTLEAGPNLQYGPEQTPKRSWNGMGEYPSDSPAYKPFPSSAETDKQPSATSPGNTPSSVISKRATAMKGVECRRDSGGVITLVGQRSNLKVDNLTTYIFASTDLAVPSAK